MDLSPQDISHLRRIEQDVLHDWQTRDRIPLSLNDRIPLPLNDRVSLLVDRLLDAGRRDEARVLYDAMETLRSIYLGTPRGMDLAGAVQLLAEAAARIRAAAAGAR
jgi:hypothetical protein